MKKYMKILLLSFLIISTQLSAKELFSIYLVGEASDPNAQAKIVRKNNSKIYITKRLELNQTHIEKAYVVKEGKNSSSLYLKFSKEGNDILYKLTRENIGKRLAFLLDQEVITVPQVYAPIRHHTISFYDKFTFKEAKEVSTRINKLKD